MTRSAATIATGRRDGRRSRAQVDERQRDQQDQSRIVGIPTVPRMTDSGHLKIRSR